MKTVTEEDLAEVLREPPSNMIAKMDEVAARYGFQPGFPERIVVSPEVWAMWQAALAELNAQRQPKPPS